MIKETKKFQRKKEDFICEECGTEVKGDGYTDHCPRCLTGKHVDINPGDRAATCGGKMKPIGYENKAGETKIKYQCQECGHLFLVKMAKEDSLEVLLKTEKE
ncbi:RNHCP domain-containing protein [Patescibacteria group bacterium]|nr:RNHCP domain-containing protein [Patescibacteria group bacterium]